MRRILALALAMTVLLVLMVAMVFVNATMRYVLGKNIMQFEEYSRFCFVWASYLGIILAFKEKRHVAVTVVVDLVKSERGKRVMAVLCDLITLVVLAFVFYGGVIYTLNANYKTAATGTNYMVLTVGIPLMAACSMGIILADLYRTLVKKEKEA